MRGKLWIFLWIAALAAVAYSCEDEEQEPPCGTSLTKFTGTWNVTEECDTFQYSYALSIAENDSGGITLSNLGGGGSFSVVEASVEGDAFTISPQLVQGIATAGNGSLNAGCVKIVIQWTGAKGLCACTGNR